MAAYADVAFHSWSFISLMRSKFRRTIIRTDEWLAPGQPLDSAATGTAPLATVIQHGESTRNFGVTLLAKNSRHWWPRGMLVPGPIHGWLRERLLEAAIPFRAVERFHAECAGRSEFVDMLLEHLPMTREEIE